MKKLPILVMPLRQDIDTNSVVGFIPSFLDTDRPEDAKTQFDRRYPGGWMKFEGFTLDQNGYTLSYPGDPPMEPLVAILFRTEIILVYTAGWVCILQPDGEWEAARMN